MNGERERGRKTTENSNHKRKFYHSWYCWSKTAHYAIFFRLSLSLSSYLWTYKRNRCVSGSVMAWAACAAYNSLPAIASFVIHYELRTEQTSHALLRYFGWVEHFVFGENIFSHAIQDHDDDDDVDDDKRVVARRGNDVFGALFCGLLVFASFFFFVNAFVFCRIFFSSVSLSACGRSVLNASTHIKISFFLRFRR